MNLVRQHRRNFWKRKMKADRLSNFIDCWCLSTGVAYMHKVTQHKAQAQRHNRNKSRATTQGDLNARKKGGLVFLDIPGQVRTGPHPEPTSLQNVDSSLLHLTIQRLKTNMWTIENVLAKHIFASKAKSKLNTILRNMTSIGQLRNAACWWAL